MAMHRMILYLMALAAVLGGAVLFAAQVLLARRTGAHEEIWTGLFWGGLLVFLAVLLVVRARQVSRPGAGGEVVAASWWTLSLGQDTVEAGPE